MRGQGERLVWMGNGVQAVDSGVSESDGGWKRREAVCASGERRTWVEGSQRSSGRGRGNQGSWTMLRRGAAVRLQPCRRPSNHSSTQPSTPSIHSALSSPAHTSEFFHRLSLRRRQTFRERESGSATTAARTKILRCRYVEDSKDRAARSFGRRVKVGRGRWKAPRDSRETGGSARVGLDERSAVVAQNEGRRAYKTEE